MDSPYSLQAYIGRRIVRTSAPTTQTNTSASSPIFEYDAEAAQMKGHGGLCGTPPPLKKGSSLGKKDMGVFERYLEKGPALGGTTAKLRSREDSFAASETSTVILQEGTPKAKSGRNSLKITCWIFVILIVLGILWIPGILSCTEFPKATMLGIGLLSWSIWLTFVWAGFWTVIAVSYLTSIKIKSASPVTSVHRWQHIHEVRAAHRYLGIFFLAVAVWLSYQLLIVRTLPATAPAENTAVINLFGRFLLGKVICAAFLALEKSSIQSISEKFHERSYAKRIQDLETIVQALCMIYKNTVDVVVQSGARDSELIIGSVPRPGIQFSALRGQTPEASIILALSTPGKSRSFARRIFYSFSRPGTNHVMAEDIAAFSSTPEDAAVAFAVFDRDGNGDVSREELEAMCLEFHQEQTAIADSMRDMNAALIQLNSIMMSFTYIACAVIIAVVMEAQIATLIAGVGVLVLGLSWLIGGSLQEVMTSIIFLFAKHPFDVGDSVIIKNETYRVKEIKLLSTVFLDSNSTLVQVSNHQLNNLFIFNSRRSSHMSETFLFDVHQSTTFQDVERIREKMLEFVKSEKRDFQPVFDVVVKDFPGQSKMVLSADIKYKSNILGLKVTRRNKWLCALKSTLAELHIYGPTGDRNAPLTVQRYTNVEEVEQIDRA